MLPVVSIVGRPNVGKSTLFNTFARRRISIVEPTPGVTRDRISTELEHNGKRFELIDTGGIGIVDCQDLDELIELQISAGIERACLILFLVSVHDGVTALDRDIALRLRRTGKPLLLAVNKVDNFHQEIGIHEFQELGLGDPQPVSGLQGFGRTDLLDLIAERLPEPEEPSEAEDVMHVAVVGRRNVGKSTFVNALTGSERVIVSDVPGTTRDAVDVSVEIDGQRLVLVDTAGMQKAKQVKGSIEFYSQARTESSVRRCDVAVFLLDATLPVGELERRIGGLIVENSKPCVIVANKWDLVEGKMRTGAFREYLDKTMAGLRHAPLVCASALEGRLVKAAIKTARSLFDQAGTRMPTWKVNQALKAARDIQRPRAKTFIPRIYYGTQIEVHPPTFLCFVNKPKAFDKSYRRFLCHQLQERLDFPEVPLKIIFRERRSFFEETEDGAPQTGKRRKRD